MSMKSKHLDFIPYDILNNIERANIKQEQYILLS